MSKTNKFVIVICVVAIVLSVASMYICMNRQNILVWTDRIGSVKSPTERTITIERSGRVVDSIDGELHHFDLRTVSTKGSSKLNIINKSNEPVSCKMIVRILVDKPMDPRVQTIERTLSPRNGTSFVQNLGYANQVQIKRGKDTFFYVWADWDERNK